MLELVYITVLETVAERIRGSTPLLPTTAPAPQGSGVFIWLRSTEVVHYLGKIEVTGSNPVGASIIITMRYGCFCFVVKQGLCARE